MPDNEIVTADYSGPERRRRVRATPSQFAEFADHVVESTQLRSLLDHKFGAVGVQLQTGEDRMSRLEAALGTNTQITAKMAVDTKEIKEILELGRALFKFASYFGRFLRWAASLAIAGGTLWAAITHLGDKTPGP